MIYTPAPTERIGIGKDRFPSKLVILGALKRQKRIHALQQIHGKA
jgi:hypothetical protein